MSTAIEARYRVVTPLFCAGTDPTRAELRLPGFKGVLRFWWRARAWSRLGGDLGAIRRKEDALFGSASGGRSRVVMRLVNWRAPRTVRIGEVLARTRTGTSPVGEGARYLGYGLMEAFVSRSRNTAAGQLTRACLWAPFDFTVQLRCRDLDSEALSSLTDALKVVGLLGGMGARSRRGYGSLVLRSIRVANEETWSAPASLEDLKDAVADLRQEGAPPGLPEYTALSGRTRHVLLTSRKREPLDLLDLVGRELVRYRSWGRQGTILKKEMSEKNFRDDHDLMKSASPRIHPRRIAFGLPHDYGKARHEKVGPFDRNLDRRASPLFIHIHECGGAPVALLSFLPARFLPRGRSYVSVGGRKIAQKPEEELYQPIHEFLDRLLDPARPMKPITVATEVGP